MNDKSPCPDNCPQCGGRGYRLWPSEGGWHRIRCSAFTTPPPDTFRKASPCNSFIHAPNPSPKRSAQSRNG
jgi:hypothetical protein